MLHKILFFMAVDEGRIRELIIQHCPDGVEFLRS
jgi:hypothetical protein